MLPLVSSLCSLLIGAGSPSATPLVVAVIDDGFRLSRPDLAPFWLRKPSRTAGVVSLAAANDRNDTLGWDLADNDGDVRPLTPLASRYAHGTQVSGRIASALRQNLGDKAAQRVKIYPVKVLPDGSDRPDMSRGYEGLYLATLAGARIAVCAWSGGHPSDQQRAWVAEAVAKGMLVLASSGNEWSESEQFPASLPGVVSVTGVDARDIRVPMANIGPWVTLASRADTAMTSSGTSDTGLAAFANTSRAVADVAGVAASIWALHPDFTAEQVRQILTNAAQPVEASNGGWSGRMGAGRVEPAASLAAADTLQKRGTLPHDSLRPRGTLLARSKAEWSIAPAGNYHGVLLSAASKAAPRGKLEVRHGDSLVWSGDLARLGLGISIPFDRLHLRWIPAKPGATMMLDYRMSPIDSSSLYCSELHQVEGDSGVLDDGSGPAPYAHRSVCKWQITVAQDKRIQFDFGPFDTHANQDFVYLFDGDMALPANQIAQFSGPAWPPAVVSRTHSVLLWWLTSADGVGDGWHLRWKAVPLSVAPGLQKPHLVVDSAKGG